MLSNQNKRPQRRDSHHWGRKYKWLRGRDLNSRPSGYEPDELPDCSTPRCQFLCGRRNRTGFVQNNTTFADNDPSGAPVCTALPYQYIRRQSTITQPYYHSQKHASRLIYKICCIKLIIRAGELVNIRPFGETLLLALTTLTPYV